MTALAITIAVLFSGQDTSSTSIRDLLSEHLEDPQRIFAQLGSLSIPLESPVTREPEPIQKNARPANLLAFKTGEMRMGIDLAAQKIFFFAGPYPVNEAWGTIAGAPEPINDDPAQESNPKVTAEAPPHSAVPESREIEEILERLRQRRIAESETESSQCDKFRNLIPKTMGQQRIQSILQRFGSDTPVPIEQIHLIIQDDEPFWFFLSPLGTSLREATRFTVCAIPASDLQTPNGGYEIGYNEFEINVESPSDNQIAAADARKRILEIFENSQQGEELDGQVRQGYWTLEKESRELGTPVFEPGWVFTAHRPHECDELPIDSPTKLYFVGKNSGELHDLTR